MMMRQVPVLAALISACILSVPNVQAADFLSDQPNSPAGVAHTAVWAMPLSKLSTIAETFRANHLVLTSTNYSFNSSEFFSNSQSLLTSGAISKHAIPKTNSMVLASLALMALIARRRSYR